MKTTADKKTINTSYSNRKNNRRKPTEKQIENMRAKRAELKALSAPLKELKKEGLIDSINEGLSSIYSKQGHTTLKTLRQWNFEGFSVKKGEKAFLLWGRPTVSQKKEVEEQQGKDSEQETDILDFYPICFVFSNLQVHERTTQNQ